MARAILPFLISLSLWFPAGRVSAQQWHTHTVRRGETLSTIAAQHHVTVSELESWNHLASDRILAGQRLKIRERERRTYVVRRGDNLSRIAERFHVPLALLRTLNGLHGDTIHPGQTLKLRPSPRDEAVHVVKHGEILTRIAARHGLSVARLMSINGLSDDRIYPGQKLRLKEATASIHIVERGDALWEIAQAYGLSVAALKRLNGLSDDLIYPGQELKLGRDTGPLLSTYKVKRGDNLIAIARLHQMSLRQLKELNHIRGSVIQPDQVLQVRPLLGAKRRGAPTAADVNWAALRVSVPGVKMIQSPNGPYYYSAPRSSYQKHKTYLEEAETRPRAAYERAHRLWQRFAAAVTAQGVVSHRLAGWHIVLDPGHGGIDPGTIVEGKDDAGKSFFIVEDEYVYDLSLRVYVLLKRQGADVTMTLLSPNHLLRHNVPVNDTFAHERNEIFNDKAWNRSNKASCWPKSGQRFFDERVNIAKRAWRGVPKKRQLYLSFHADNDPVAGDAVTLFYYRSRRRADTISRAFARKMLPAIGAGARVKGRGLGVLRKNPARYKLLVEMRNLANHDHIWSIRYEQLRQRDAEKVVQAILDATSP